jgi:hypothetical protein
MDKPLEDKPLEDWTIAELVNTIEVHERLVELFRSLIEKRMDDGTEDTEK